MDNNNNNNNNITNSSTVKTPEADSETPTRIQPANGVLKRHPPVHLHHHHPIVLSYKECLKNHAATMGAHALDGCGEFMPSPTTNPSDPTTLKCAACGCHRNFHRREPEDPPHGIITQHQQQQLQQSPAIEFQPLHRTHPNPVPPRGGSPDDSPSPPPISSAYYPPHMLLALGHGEGNNSNNYGNSPVLASSPVSALFQHNRSRKRFRTKFTQNQKEKMVEFAERVGWKMQKRDEEAIEGFCGEIGVDKSVFKVWMHNNKNTFGKKEQQQQQQQQGSGDGNIAISTPPPVVAGNGAHENNNGGGGEVHVSGGGGNGGSSSSS